jgi:hypothetical protein
MNKLLYNSIRILSIGALMVYYYYYLSLNLIPEVHFQIQQPPFMALKSFFYGYLSYPGGISEYLASFFSQFFSLGWPGAIIILTALGAIAFIFFAVLKQFAKSELLVFFACVPSILASGLFNNYYFPFAVIVKLLLTVSSIWALTYAVTRKTKVWIALSLLMLLTYYVAGSGAYMIFSLSSICVLIYHQGFKKSLLVNSSIIAISAILPYILFKKVFNLTLEDAYFSLVPDLPKMIRYKPELLFKSAIISIPAIIVILSFSRRIFESRFALSVLKLKQWIRISIAFACSFIFLFFMQKISFSKQKHDLALIQYYNNTQQWQKVIETTEETTEYNMYVNYYYNIAIDHKGIFLDAFFNYPQLLGADGLYPDKIMHGEIASISSEYYFDLGYISESQRWSQTLLTVMPYNLQALKREVINNLITGNYSGAKKYLTILENNFLARDFTDKYRQYIADTSLVAADKLIAEKRAFSPVVQYVPEEITLKFQDLVKHNPKNRCAYEHLLMAYLLNHNVVRFFDYLQNYEAIFNNFPLTFQYGSIIYVIKTNPAKIPEIELSEYAKNSFRDFNKIVKEYKGNNQAASVELSANYRNTYLYYLLFDSPIVTKNNLKVREENYALN